MRLVATAGHVDHGKSTLVRALTGTDPDRWEEEKRRGMTIDLGFARMSLPDGEEIEFIDVPGHVRFVRNMIAGVGSVDLCLFVVAANEGWKPQSEEHLRILELVGVNHGVVALTKASTVGEEGLAAASAAVTDRLRNTFLADAPVVACDAVAGIGLDALSSALEALPDPGAGAVTNRPRLWVDRSFSIRGSGTVVTGTLTGGFLAVNDSLDLLPRKLRVRVRGLQSHGRRLERAESGRRTALNLVGVGHGEVGRGDALVRADQWAPTAVFDGSLQVLGAVSRPITRRGAYLAYIGSGEHSVRLRLLEAAELEPGATGLARLHLPLELPLLPGDRYVIRDAGRGETIGGGEVLDVAPVLPVAKASPDRSVERVVRERGWVDVDDLERLTGVRREPTVGRWVVAPDALETARAKVRSAAEAGAPFMSLNEHHRELALTMDEIAVRDGTVTTTAADAASERPSADQHPFLRALAANPFAPPSAAEAGCPPDEVRMLIRRGAVVERDGIYFATEAVAEAAARVALLLAASPAGVSASAVREALGTSRKYAIPLLEHLDATGVTRRRGDVRVAGPRLPKPASG